MNLLIMLQWFLTPRNNYLYIWYKRIFPHTIISSYWVYNNRDSRDQLPGSSRNSKEITIPKTRGNLNHLLANNCIFTNSIPNFITGILFIYQIYYPNKPSIVNGTYIRYFSFGHRMCPRTFCWQSKNMPYC